jgi:predicted kinase
MTSLVCLRGLPGSGKSTFAKANLGMLSEYVRVNRDDLRQSLFDGQGILEPWQENLITKVQRSTAAAALKAGKSVIVDDTNLRHKYLRAWNEFALEQGAGFTLHDVITPVDVCVERDSARERSVGEKVIRDMADRFTKPCTYRGYKFPEYYGLPEVKYEDYLNPSHLPHVVIVDIDGTMALMGDRSPYDWKAVSQDMPNKPVVDLVRHLLIPGTVIIFLSGRDGSCREETLQWLRSHLPRGYDNRWRLFMRETGDNRRDDIVKREIFDREIRDQYHVKFVLDDRNQVVRMWRALGLPVFQVADGDF